MGVFDIINFMLMIVRLIFGIIVLCFFSTFSLNGQDSDSLENLLSHVSIDTSRFQVLKQLVIFHKNRDSEKALKYLDEARHLADSINDNRGSYAMDFFKAEILFNQGAYNEALDFYNRFLKYHEALNNRRDLAEGYAGKSLVFLYTNSSDSVMSYGLRALDIFETLSDTIGMIQSLYRIGQVQAQVDNYDQALNYFEKGTLMAEALGHTFYKPNGYNGLGTILLYKSGDFKDKSEVKYLEMQASALAYFEKAKVGFEILGIDQYVAAAVHNMGLIELNLEKWKEAKKSFEQASSLSAAYANPGQIHRTESSYADALFHLGEFNQAEDLLRKGLEHFKAQSDTEGIQSNVRRLRELYTAKGDYKRALTYALENQDISKEIFESDRIKQIEELEVSFETERKEQQIEVLNVQNEYSAARLKASQRLSMWLGLISLIFLGFILALYFLYKKISSQRDKITKTMNEKDVLMREIHHRVKNNLQVVSSLLNLQSRDTGDERAKKALMESKNRVKSMALIHQRLYQEDNLTGVHIKEYLSSLTKSVFNSYQVLEDRVSLHLDIEDLNIDVDTLIPIGLIVNELVSNALKYAYPNSKKGVINVSLKEELGVLKLRVSDDGIGLDKKNESKLESSFGYKLINAFSSQLNGELSIDGDAGTSVLLLINDYKKVA